jgi:hypothetical protein
MGQADETCFPEFVVRPFARPNANCVRITVGPVVLGIGDRRPARDQERAAVEERRLDRLDAVAVAELLLRKRCDVDITATVDLQDDEIASPRARVVGARPGRHADDEEPVTANENPMRLERAPRLLRSCLRGCLVARTSAREQGEHGSQPRSRQPYHRVGSTALMPT